MTVDKRESVTVGVVLQNTREARNIHGWTAVMIRIQPKRKGKEVISSTVFLPIRSIRAPPLKPPNRAPRVMREATQENSRSERGSRLIGPKSVLFSNLDPFLSCGSAGDDQPRVVPMIRAPIDAVSKSKYSQLTRLSGLKVK